MKTKVNEADYEDIEKGDIVILDNGWLVGVDSLFHNGFFTKQKPRMDEGSKKMILFKDIVKNFKTLKVDEIHELYPEYFI